MNHGGVVRNLDSWGTLTLPQRMHRRKQWHNIGEYVLSIVKALAPSHTTGSYWTMDFDASPKTLHSLSGLLRHDPRVIRWTMIKLGEKVEDVVEPPAKTLKAPPLQGMGI